MAELPSGSSTLLVDPSGQPDLAASLSTHALQQVSTEPLEFDHPGIHQVDSACRGAGAYGWLAVKPLGLRVLAAALSWHAVAHSGVTLLPDACSVCLPDYVRWHCR